MANERPLGLRTNDKKVEENWSKIDWNKSLDNTKAVVDAEINNIAKDEEGLEIINLTAKEFNDLLEYSHSQPTGVVIGKKWKRREDANGTTKWFMGEYTQCPVNTNMSITKWKRILVPESADSFLNRLNKSELPIMYLISTINGDVLLKKDLFAVMIQEFWAFAKCKTDDDYINAFWKEFWPEADSSKSNWANLLYNDKLTNFSYFIYGWGSSCGLKFEPRS